jgi:hypothetical protein
MLLKQIYRHTARKCGRQGQAKAHDRTYTNQRRRKLFHRQNVCSDGLNIVIMHFGSLRLMKHEPKVYHQQEISASTEGGAAVVSRIALIIDHSFIYIIRRSKQFM